MNKLSQDDVDQTTERVSTVYEEYWKEDNTV